VERLSEGAASVSELARPFDMTLCAVVQHLWVLEENGVVRSEKVGRVRICHLDPAGIEAVADWAGHRRSAMEGTEYVSLTERIRTTSAMVALARKTAASGAQPSPPPRDIDPRVLVSAISAMILGWASVEDWVWPTAEIDPAEKDEVYRQLREIVGYLADLILVPGITGDQAK
jgi:DNA-binding transcriptional ArsR family regulator